jgi:DNA polymerase (family X)
MGALSLVAVDPDLRCDDRTVEQGGHLVIHLTSPDRYGIGRQLLKRPGYEVDRSPCSKPTPVTASRSRSTPTPGAWTWTGAGARPRARLHVQHQPQGSSVEEIDNIQWGVLMARKGGSSARKGAVSKERVLNALGRAEFSAYLESRRARPRAPRQ